MLASVAALVAGALSMAAAAAAFFAGGALPMMAALLLPMADMVTGQYFIALVGLVILGYASARTGGVRILRPIVRITFWGTIAMGVTAAVGYLFSSSSM